MQDYFNGCVFSRKDEYFRLFTKCKKKKKKSSENIGGSIMLTEKHMFKIASLPGFIINKTERIGKDDLKQKK
jgi:hypothetical protein